MDTQCTIEILIEILIELDGDLRATRWTARLHKYATPALKWLDAQGLTRWVQTSNGRRKRVLFHDLQTTVDLLHDCENFMVAQHKRSGRHSKTSERVIVVEDPSGFFTPGAEFERFSVFGGRRSEWLKPGELPDNIKLRYDDQLWTMVPGVGLCKVEV